VSWDSFGVGDDRSGVDGLPIVAFASRADWEEWLASEHARAAGVWLKIAKKGSGIESVNYAEALDGALCWGWIDGQRGRFDELWFLTRFTPRKPRSRWSANNCAKVDELIARAEMQPAGLEQVSAAKADGRWDAAYPGQRDAVVPADFRQALDANRTAAEFFAALDGSNRYAFLYRLHHLTGADARAERIAGYVAMLARGATLHD
jgi:uncharacterized protein YdeI (YjbR/CyaY-like superfamily)